MVFVVAEIGINHNGSLEIAKKLIDAAKVSGCDAVKFQKRTIDLVYTKDVLDSPRESPWGKTQRDQKNGLEFNYNDYLEAYCHTREADRKFLHSSISSFEILKEKKEKRQRQTAKAGREGGAEIYGEIKDRKGRDEEAKRRR